MINYTPQNQLSLELFKHPFEQELDKTNRWVKLETLIPWDELAGVYGQKLDSDFCRKSVDFRMVIAAVIVKHQLNLDDRGTVQMISENLYIQYFCGMKEFSTKQAFDPSLFVDIRKRLGNKEFDKFNCILIETSENIKPHQSRIKTKSSSEKNDNETGGIEPKNKGTLKIDATVADQEIKYPTDLNLLNESRENLERIINLLYISSRDGVRPRTYRRKARKEFLLISKKRRKSNKEIRRGIKGQLQYIRRDLKITDTLLSKPGKNVILENRDKKLLETIRQMYEQQKWMYENKTHRCPNRIVNIYQAWVRPIVRGKDKNKVEFGSKINLTEVEGFSRINHFSWEAFNEGKDLVSSVENFRKLYGRYPRYILIDKIYLSRENRKYLKEKNIETFGKPLGRPPKQAKQSSSQKYRKKKKAAERNHVEAKFGQGKRGYGMNNIKARLSETSESMVNSIVFVMNLMKLLQIAEKYKYFSDAFFVSVKNWIIKLKNDFIPRYFSYPSKYSRDLVL
jgi:hypothetical protein